MVGKHGEQVVDLLDWIRVSQRRPVKRWQVATGSPHTDHHVTVEAAPDGRYGVRSTYSEHRDVWVYQDVAGAKWRLGELWRARRSWTWTELPPTPYDTELGVWPED
jgi:hypothetical protein